ncbi:hypothetical protein MBM_02384 [Drepanopeziza brunnea f. sp. 'multigermtubi' MB_m1]|uniref:DRBM domain-containing protein n=1 Tax=Marssonina brunnea f. sp. multigermtubi (strain MB_m1) TaxID=1072389 RepID=K1X2E2_MARBU|nr:uncharacterized protein MBM_02384 [Drepanopeziza brunnea f. sp. 'multigermtubi' MB_m1]EKD19147.1 hypothetical protein MBM_02384 [Drepanopeziza brunnea f. sp. 'multigermtubi' MB_m1]
MAEMTQTTPASASAMTLQFHDMDEWVAEVEKKAKETEAAKKRNENVKPAAAPSIANKVIDPVDLEADASERLANVDLGEKNWIGLIQQYRDAHPIAGVDKGLTWVENQTADVIPRFRCTLAISESEETFGNDTGGLTTKAISFSSKKLAKKYAAKKAVEWLIENGHMPADGGVKFPKVATPPVPAARPKSPGGGTTSYTTRVPEICSRLGFTPPRYNITSAVKDMPGPLWDGFADFGGDPRIEGKVGQVTNVFGKKNAKEEVAKLVYSFMENIERHRLGESPGEEDKKRKWDETSLPGSQEDAAKLIKL